MKENWKVRGYQYLRIAIIAPEEEKRELIKFVLDLVGRLDAVNINIAFDTYQDKKNNNKLFKGTVKCYSIEVYELFLRILREEFPNN